MKLERAFATILLVATAASAQETAIHIAQISPLSGPAASIGLPLTQAAHAYVNRINAEGGIGGKKIVLEDRDDGFKPERTIEHVEQLISARPPVALLNVVGAPNNGELVTRGLLAKHKMSVVGAFTGATSVRELKSPYMYFIRASVADEARKMVQQVVTIGMTRVALVHANDAFGHDARGFVDAALKMHGAVLSAAESYEPATVDVAPAVTRVRSSDAQAVLIFGTGPAAAKFVVEYRKAGGGGLLIANSSTSPEVMARLAGNTMARGVGLVQVVPAVTKTTIPVVKEYQDTLARYGKPDWKPSAYGLEGFLAAKLLVEGLRRAGPSPTRESLSAALDRIEQFDAGGITLDYKSGRREGLRSVDIGILGAEGRLMN